MLLNKRNYLIKLSMSLLRNQSNFFFINFNSKKNYLNLIRKFIKINYFNKNDILFYNKNIFIINFKELEFLIFFIFFFNELLWENIKFFGIYFKNNYLNCKNRLDLQFYFNKLFSINNYFYFKIIEIYMYILFFILNFFYKIIFFLRLKC